MKLRFMDNVYSRKKKKKYSTDVIEKHFTDVNEKPSSVCYKPLIVILFFNFLKGSVFGN